MREKMKSEKSREIHSKRKMTVEPVFGIIKHVFRQFLLRGLETVSWEWDLVTFTYNFKRLWNLKRSIQTV
jgi:hypothetical protein